MVSLLYPPRCVVCLEFGPDIVCARCLELFVSIDGPVCQRCGIELLDDPENARRGLCENCRQLVPYSFTWARAQGRYDGALRAAIHRLKYDGRMGVAHVLGTWMRSGSALRPPHTPDIVMPVPLHPSRMRERGFNQSELIARAFVGDRGWPLDVTALRRVRRTKPQATLKVDQRAENVRNAFAVAEPETVRGRRVLLVDDVLTTMHTVTECSRVLKEAGATDVYVAAVAR